MSSLVRREVEGRFPSTDVDDVVDGLATIADLPGCKNAYGRARIQLAILLCANGDLAEFRSALDLAQTDWRDLLVDAGLEHDNWREVLARAGFPVPESR